MSTKKRAPKKPIDYAQGKIYKIINDANNIVYIGSTVNQLTKRFSTHKSVANTQPRESAFYTAMREIGVEHFRILLIELFPCKCKAELEAREYETIDALIAAGKSVYNRIIGGKPNMEVRAKIAAAKKGKVQEEAQRFAFGCISCAGGRWPRWSFRWYENDKQRTKSFSVAKYGDAEAKALAEAERRRVYPEWESDDEEDDDQCQTDDAALAVLHELAALAL